ncbi:MAG: DUF1223 domain-containing protein [Candidatus Acidiferrales bacterium]
MKIISAAAQRILCALGVFCCYPALTATPQTVAPNSDRKPVLVELFTSEGCSSCPPADELLQKLQEQQPLADADVIPLEEHVDYWNHDGWNDPYSSAEWTQRQLVYSTRFHGQEYTPQMVVNGEAQLVGSDSQEAFRAIESAARHVETLVTVTSGKPDAKGSQQFAVSVGPLAGQSPGDSAEVWLAVTEDDLQSSVNRGENSGRVLRHIATLRSLRKIGAADPSSASASFSGDFHLSLDSQWNRDHLHVVVFIQEKESRKILGAASTKVVR